MPALPELDPNAPLVPLKPGTRNTLLWIRPVYHELGYDQALPEVWLRVEVVNRLIQAAAELIEQELAILVWDGWRSLELQSELWQEYRAELDRSSGLGGAALDEETRKFVSPPDSDGPPPAHSTGGAVDLTLCSPHGKPVDMGGEFDELTPRSFPEHYERGDLSLEETAFRDRRRLLGKVMAKAGFWRFPTEWWHFEYGTPNWASWAGARPEFDPIPSQS